MKIVFMGTPMFSVSVLEGLIENYDVVGVVTQPDKLVGRKQILTFSPVKELALKNNIKVLQPIKIKDDYQDIIDLKPDIIITCAYGQIIPDELLNYPKYKAINVHASLLPKYRGGAPIHWAIINDEKYTGITIMEMVSKMDAGDILTQEKIQINETDTKDIIEKKLAILGKDLLLKTLPLIFNNSITRIKQNEKEVTYAYTIKREDEKIDFNKSAKEIYNQIRALYPNPGAYAYLDDKLIKIYSAKNNFEKENNLPGTIASIGNDYIAINTKQGQIMITEIKLEGKNKTTVKDYLNGIDKSLLKEKQFK